MAVPAVVTAGDRRAAKAVYGESKVYLEIEGEPLVARVVAMLQRVPEVSEVWVVGNAERLEKVFAREDVRASLHKPLRVVEQFRNLYENCWETYRRLLPGAPAEGRDPESDADRDVRVLYLSGDLPFATPQEISQFIRRAEATECDYALGLVTEEVLVPFYPTAAGEPGIPVAYFNLREARLRQSNLHLARPGRLGNRHYIEEMYEHRHQREIGDMLGLMWRLLRSKQGGLTVVFFFLLMHLGGVADRWGWRRLADWLRQTVSIARTEAAVSRLLRTRFRFVLTEIGGSAIDIDTEAEYDAARARFAEWTEAQQARAEALVGELPPLPAEAGRAPRESGGAA